MNLSRPEAEAELARVLLPLARRWRAVADRAVAGLGLSNATGWVLLHVGRLGDSVRQTDLAAALDIQGASLVRLVDQLEQAGLVDRVRDAVDRRANRVALTDAGRAMVEEIEGALGAIRNAMFDGIGDTQLAIANDVLSLLDRHILDHQASSQ